jgi:hypothetical protein
MSSLPHSFEFQLKKHWLYHAVDVQITNYSQHWHLHEVQTLPQFVTKERPGAMTEEEDEMDWDPHKEVETLLRRVFSSTLLEMPDNDDRSC